MNMAKMLAAGLAKNRTQLDRLKMDAAQELLNAEIAQRTKDTPPALQYENVAPYEYFARLVASFESQMLVYRRQIEETEQHLQTMATQETLAPEDIMRAIQKLQDSFTNLAGRYQKFHEAVAAQKEVFVQHHRQKYGMTTDLFARADKSESRKSSSSVSNRFPPTTVGPSPFTAGQNDLLAMARASLMANRGPSQQQQQQIGGTSLTSQAPPPTHSLGQPQGFPSWNTQPQQQTSVFQSPFGVNPTPGILGNTLSPFTSNVGGTAQSSIFATGGKRGKH